MTLYKVLGMNCITVFVILGCSEFYYMSWTQFGFMRLCPRHFKVFKYSRPLVLDEYCPVICRELDLSVLPVNRVMMFLHTGWRPAQRVCALRAIEHRSDGSVTWSHFSSWCYCAAAWKKQLDGPMENMASILSAAESVVCEATRAFVKQSPVPWLCTSRCSRT